jgi:hypothetical protein
MKKSSVSEDFFSPAFLWVPLTLPVLCANNPAAHSVPQEIDKGADPQRQMAALREYRIDIVARRRMLVQHRHQFARLDFRSHFPHRAPGQALAGQRPVVQHLRHRCTPYCRHLQVTGLPLSRKVQPRWLPSLLIARQLWRARSSSVRGVAVALQVGGRGHHHALVVGQLDADQVGIGQAGDADRHVDAFADDVDHAVVQVQVGRHVAVLGQEGGQQRRHVLAPEAGRRRDQQVSRGARAALRHRRFRFFQFRQDALAIFEEGAPSSVSASLRVVRCSSLTPRRLSSASRRRPIMAGAMPSARAAADRLPRATTSTKVEICLNCPTCRPVICDKNA